jgi:Double zinc ribbon
MKSKIFPVQINDFSPLTAELSEYFRSQEHEVQLLPFPGGQVLQAQRETTFGALTGQSSALTIKLEWDSQGVKVEIGSSKWIDKAAVGIISYAIMPILAIFPIIGAYNQYKLSEDTWRIIEAFFARYLPTYGYSAGYNAGNYNAGNYNAGGAGNYSNPHTANPGPSSQNAYRQGNYNSSNYSQGSYNQGSWAGGANCPSCQAAIAPYAVYCSRCGNRVGQTTTVCTQCGNLNQPGSQFCYSCGGKF